MLRQANQISFSIFPFFFQEEKSEACGYSSFVVSAAILAAVVCAYPPVRAARVSVGVGYGREG